MFKKHDHLPQYSLDFDGSSIMAQLDSDLNIFLKIHSFYLRFKRDGTGVEEYLFSHGDGVGSGSKGFSLWIESTGEITFQVAVSVCTGGSPPVCSLETNYFTSTTTVDDTDWHDVLVVMKCGNNTAANRIKMWIDGSAETASASDLSNKGDHADSSSRLYLGSDYLTNNKYTGLMYNLGISKNGNGWATSDVRESDDTAKDLKDLNLWVHPDTDAGEEESDWIISTNYLNTGVVTSSTLGDDAI